MLFLDVETNNIIMFWNRVAKLFRLDRPPEGGGPAQANESTGNPGTSLGLGLGLEL